MRIGLFGTNYGEIKNLGIEICNISGVLESESENVNSVMTGGVVGDNNGKIYNCYVSGNILSKAINTAKSFVGGICGRGVTMEYCYNLATISGICDKGSNLVGGICGCAKSNFTPLKNCYNKGEVIATGGKKTAVGGIIGLCEDTTNVPNISYCYNLGNLTLMGEFGNILQCGGIIGRTKRFKFR